MDKALAGQRALVTAGASGIGRAIARRFAAEGARIFVCDVDGKALSAFLAENPGSAGILADVSDPAQVDRLFDAVAAGLGGLDILVNNAGIAGPTRKVEEVAVADWDRCIAINLNGMFYCTRRGVPLLKAAGGGSIVNLSSIAGLIGVGGIAPYHASKGAVRLMTKNDAITYAPERIRVNSIHPGYIWTPMVENHLRATSDDLEAAKAAAGSVHPLGHMGEPDDIAWAVVWLASDEAKFVTGAEIVIDGGYTAR